MKRSKNHVLYELFLEEAGETSLFEKTKKYSLGHLIKFVDNYESLDGLGSSELVSLISGEKITSIDDMKDEHFSLYSIIKSLNELLTEEDVNTIAVTIDRIDRYHEEKRAEKE